MSFANYFSDGQIRHAPARLDADGRVVNVGFDDLEGVQKVATMVWNPSTLSWNRATAPTSASASPSTATANTTKRIDKPSATLMYVGEAAVGTVETATGWGIKKIEFDASGNATAVLFAIGAWTNRVALTYT